LLLTVVSTCTLEVAIAHADDVVTTPFDGVRHIARTTATPNRIHIVEVDLTNPKVRMRATRPGERGQVVSGWAQAAGCQIATNADFFSYETYSTSGLAVGHGVVWDDSAADTKDHGVLAFGVDNHALLARPGLVTPVEDWMSDVVSGHPVLVRDGVRVDYDPCTDAFCARNPRTAVGLSQDGATLWMVTVDGRSSSSVGATLNELGGLMKSLGAHTAINLDGGGSTTMYVKGKGVVNSPSDGAQRVVANHLGVCIVPPFGTLKGYVREGDIQDEAAGLAGIAVSLSSGQSAVTDAEGYYEIAEVPRGDVTIAVDGEDYVATEREVYVTAGDPTWGSVALVAGEDPPPDDPGGGAGDGDAGVAGASGDDMVTGSCAVGENAGGSFAVFVLLLLLVEWKLRAENRRRRSRRRAHRSPRLVRVGPGAGRRPGLPG
jgi:hypothetical protein